MNDLAKNRAAQVNAAERAVIDGIPKWLLERMDKAQAEFEAKGGCPGCGSQILAVHKWPCAWCDANPDF